MSMAIYAVDWNPGWTLFVSREYGFNSEEIARVQSAGALAGLLGIPLVMSGIRVFGVGNGGVVGSFYSSITVALYAGFRTPTMMAWLHAANFLMGTSEWIASGNRLTNLMPREDLPKCLGIILGASIMGGFAGDLVGPTLISIDFNLVFTFSLCTMAFMLYNNWLNFRKDEKTQVATHLGQDQTQAQALGLESDYINWVMMTVLISMYLIRRASVASLVPTWLPYVDKQVGPLSPFQITAIKNGDRGAQVLMHIGAGQLLKGASQRTLMSMAVLALVSLSLAFLFYEPSQTLFMLFPDARVDKDGAVRPWVIWTFGVVLGQLLTGFGVTLFGVVTLPLMQSFLRADSSFQIELAAPALYITCDMLGLAVGTYTGGVLATRFSLGQAYEIMSLVVLVSGIVASMIYSRSGVSNKRVN
eukprot:gnl/MRDRNA2_/MRDRNA2_80354_c0_seq1.p1 gnl/MRDRNA2_/MRDRNA2_80354_c0~~gnl/MRDRNA2_/MRDRNA2_80354_c0_seq1.p1  ORF type:complete len:438 (+),score=39.10 gnl/MRDRNA2_/MRDRNA2_80354_c0_seq1:69-1316(+)